MDFLIKNKSYSRKIKRRTSLWILWLVIFISKETIYLNRNCYSQPRVYKNLTIHEVMAAFLFNFTKFVDWPSEALPDSLDTISVGIIGDDPIEGYLRKITLDKTVKNKKFSIIAIENYQQLKDCQVLFISQSEQQRLPRILKRIEKLNILTVSDIDKFAVYGGIIAFVIENSEVRFIINVEAADEAHLKISSKLLNLAEVFRNDNFKNK
jgi:hypothetical protein